VGFQAKGSLGSLLEDGAKRVTIMGDEIKVAATIRRIEDYSGHADGPELVQWVKERLPIGKSIFLTHGEEEAQMALAEDIRGWCPMTASCVPALMTSMISPARPAPFWPRRRSRASIPPWWRSSTGTTTCNPSSSTSTRN
jgi:metallo-beta-lactamase family protein